MPRPHAARAGRTPRRRRGILATGARAFGLLVAVVLVLAAGAMIAAVERAPRVAGVAAPDGQSAARALELYRAARTMVIVGEGGTIEISESELNDGFAAASRLWRGLAGRAVVDENGISAVASVPVPGTGLWMNAEGSVRSDPRGLVLGDARLGRLELPHWLVAPLSRIALDLVLGERAGARLLEAVREVRTDPPTARIALAPLNEGDVAVGDGIRRLLSARAGAVDTEVIRERIDRIDAAVADGRLPAGGSFAPLLDFSLHEARREADAQAGMRTMLYALALYCGDPRFAQVIGIDAPPASARRASCRDLTLGGRRDSRQHFAVTAGIAAAISPDGARGVGELKELHDSRLRYGFDFGDIAANNAGAAFAMTALGRLSNRAGPAVRVRDERDVMPDLADLPSHLDEDAFRESFGDVTSPEYEALLEEIERRIEALPFHRADAV